MHTSKCAHNIQFHVVDVTDITIQRDAHDDIAWVDLIINYKTLDGEQESTCITFFHQPQQGE